MPAPISPWPQTQPERIPSDGWLRDRFLNEVSGSTAVKPEPPPPAAPVAGVRPWYEKHYHSESQA